MSLRPYQVLGALRSTCPVAVQLTGAGQMTYNSFDEV